MADGVNVDFGLLKSPNSVCDYANAFEVGRQLAQQRCMRGASRQFGTGPRDGIDAERLDNCAQASGLHSQCERKPDLSEWAAAADNKVRPAQAGCRRPEAKSKVAHGGENRVLTDMQIHIDAMNAQGRVAAAQKVEKIFGVLQGIQAITANTIERLRIAQHIASQNPQMGIDPITITQNDVSERTILRHMTELTRLKQQIERDDGISASTNAPASLLTNEANSKAQGQVLTPPDAPPAQPREDMKNLAGRLAKLLSVVASPSRRDGGNYSSQKVFVPCRIYNTKTGCLE